VTGDAPDQSPRPAREPGLSDETLSQLEARLDRASEMAERLIIEAAARVAGMSEGTGDDAGTGPEPEPGKPPPAGWQRREPPAADGGTGGAGGSRARGEIDMFLEVLGVLRDRIPPELQRRLGEALREVLLALRALIDWYLERTERRRAEPFKVEDIPIS
jgi:hypothetical protein